MQRESLLPSLEDELAAHSMHELAGQAANMHWLLVRCFRHQSIQIQGILQEKMNQQRSLYDESPLLSQDAAIGLLQSLGILSCAVQSNPRMSQHFFQRHSFARILCKQSGNEVFRLPRHGGRKLRIAHLDLAISVLLALVHELIEQDAKSPNIHPAVVLLVDHHLWREIVQGSTEFVTSRGRRMHCPAKVRNFQRVFQADQDVLRLDVSVNDVFRMTVLDSLHHLLEVPCRSCLGEGTAALQQSIELPTRCHFEAKVDSLLIMEEGVESQDVHMPTVRLNLDLSPELMLNSMLDELAFVQDFEGENEACSSTTSHINCAELPGTQALANVDIIQRKPRDLSAQGHVLRW